VDPPDSEQRESVSLENNDTAVVKGRYRLEGVKILGFEKAPEGGFVFSPQKRSRTLDDRDSRTAS